MNTTDALTQALLNSFHQHAAYLKGKRVWLACSGGRDSLSLAILCRQLFDAGKLPFLPQLLHVNHGMQQANTAWSEQVMTWAEHNNMLCKVLPLTLTEMTEQAARHARYQAMMSVMNTDDVLILGHHQDDQVETVLMRLFNGAGVNGLGGMREWRYQSSYQSKYATAHTTNDSDNESKSTSSHGIYLWRPWLGVSRAQITEFAHAHQLAYIDDPTNIINELSYNENKGESLSPSGNDRAWLRSVLLPHITQRYPQAKSAIARTSFLMQDAAITIDEQAQADLIQVRIEDRSWQSVIDINKLQALPMARQSALLHAWLSPTAEHLPPSKRLVDEVIELSQRQDANHQTSLYWDSGQFSYYIRRYKNQLYRLHQSWLSWLELPMIQQRIPLSASNQKNKLRLKPGGNEPRFDWQLLCVQALTTVLIKSLNDLLLCGSESDSVALNELLIESLPRNLKLGLAGRVGRKSGKKLLQALDQPSFMRQSVGLCSLITPSQKTPLLILTTQRIYLLESIYAADICALIDQDKLSIHIDLCRKN